MNIPITSDAFREGAAIPTKYTCGGNDISPALRWSDVPPNTKSFALICEDPDAPLGVFTHWVLYNLPPTVTELPEEVSAEGRLANGAIQGRNDFKRIGYGGPARRQRTARTGISLGSMRSTPNSKFKPERVERI